MGKVFQKKLHAPDNRLPQHVLRKVVSHARSLSQKSHERAARNVAFILFFKPQAPNYNMKMSRISLRLCVFA
jgi:hypothetical protein